MPEATVTSNGRITIPADIRKSMALEAGAKIVFTRLSDGTTILRAKSPLMLDRHNSVSPRTGDRHTPKAMKRAGNPK